MSILAPDARISVLIDADALAARVSALAEEIIAGMGPAPLLIPVLKGSFIFAADLLRALHVAGGVPDMDFISLSSYGAGTNSRGEVTILRDTEAEIAGRGCRSCLSPIALCRRGGKLDNGADPDCRRRSKRA